MTYNVLSGTLSIYITTTVIVVSNFDHPSAITLQKTAAHHYFELQFLNLATFVIHATFKSRLKVLLIRS